ncbi:MAG: hypothetical protein ACP5EN_11920 [Rhodovulum sp.]
MKKFTFGALTAVSGVLATTMAQAAPDCTGPSCVAVPEISALEGTAALAAVAAIVLLVWERRRRAA